MSAGYAFLPGFMKEYNEKLSIAALKAGTLNVQASRLANILFHREQRHVS